MLPSRFWELAAGALLLQCHSAGRCIPISIIGVRTIASIGVALIVFGMILTDTKAFPFPWALAPVCGTLMLISAARSPEASKSLAVSVLKNPLIVYIGRSSYSLYLWHWPVVVIMRWTVGFDTASQLVFAFVLTLILGFASYTWIEKPFLRSKPLRLFPAWQIVPSGLALTVGFAAVFYVIMKSPIHLSVTANEKGWHSGDLPNTLRFASVSSEKSTSTLWVIGDSHAGAYRGMVQESVENTGMKFKIESLSGCSVANLRAPYPDTNYCENRFNRLFAELASNYSEGDIVFLASLRGQRLSDQWGMYEPDKLDRILNGNRRDEYHKALEQSKEIVGRLLSIGYKVIIDTPKPVFRAPLFRCSDWFNHMNSVCTPGFEVSTSELKGLDAPVLESLRILKAEFPDLIVWDPFPILCPGNVCSALQDGKPLFFDQDHLSGYGNQLLLPSFSKILSRIDQRKYAQQKHPADS
jgi:hypothetical protein